MDPNQILTRGHAILCSKDFRLVSHSGWVVLWIVEILADELENHVIFSRV